MARGPDDAPKGHGGSLTLDLSGRTTGFERQCADRIASMFVGPHVADPNRGPANESDAAAGRRRRAMRGPDTHLAAICLRSPNGNFFSWDLWQVSRGKGAANQSRFHEPL
jgi:hypothetical protein